MSNNVLKSRELTFENVQSCLEVNCVEHRETHELSILVPTYFTSKKEFQAWVDDVIKATEKKYSHRNITIEYWKYVDKQGKPIIIVKTYEYINK